MHKILLALIMCISLASVSAYAEECNSSDSTQMTLYNSAHLTAIFGSAPVCENGLVHIKTTIGEGRTAREWNIGYLYGNVETREGSKNIIIENGGYISPSSIGTNISGKRILINAENVQSLLFDIEKGIYFRYGHSFWCGENCQLDASVSVQDSLFNMTGIGFYSLGIPSKNAQGEYDAETKVVIGNLRDVKVFNSQLLLGINAESFGLATFDNMNFTSEIRVNLQRINYTPDTFFDNIIAQEADIYPLEDSRIVAYPQNPTEPASIRVFKENRMISEIKGGKVGIFDNQQEYERCAFNVVFERQLALRDVMNKMSCAFFGEGLTKIDPKTALIRSAGSNEIKAPINIRVMPLPSDLKEPKFVVEEFLPDDTEGKVVLEKSSALGSRIIQAGRTISDQLPIGARALIFERDNVTIEGGNWYELGTGFSAEVYQQDEFRADKGIYNHFECHYRERQCFLDGVLVAGFSEQQTVVNCETDNDCGNAMKCISRRCVIESNCKKFAEYSTTDRDSSQAIDLMFISDGFETKEEFMTYVKGSLDMNNEANTKGLFAIEPFSKVENKKKFIVWTMFNENAEEIPGMFNDAWGYRTFMPDLSYTNNMEEQCGNADLSIVLSKNRFYAPQAERMGLAFISLPAITYNTYWGTVIGHEYGHSFGDLYDEYDVETVGAKMKGEGLITADNVGEPNCLKYTNAAVKWESLLAPTKGAGYGASLADNAKANRWYGCGARYCASPYCDGYLRPSFNSIMRHNFKAEEEGWDRYNDVGVVVIQNQLDKYRRLVTVEQ
ncbi:MAG: M64 family metallopeptidase [Candidatus Nanoarchaeia archaeon]|jgi:hypothetical protein